MPHSPEDHCRATAMIAGIVLGFFTSLATADEPEIADESDDPGRQSAVEEPAETEETIVERIARESRPALVAITHASRPRGDHREGCGFVISEDGLIATNLHVIGDARPIHVTTSDGRSLTVETVHASDRKLDLAILEVKERDLAPLTLGVSEGLRDGHPVVALGNPQGFRFSVVKGVISATREYEGIQMIQVAIPIEPGNSGGPLLDYQGRVIGIPTLKSENVGFAMPVDALKLLIEKPNPIPIERWITVGRINARKWTPLQPGAHWRQRAGKILVDGMGNGFGGRALCLFNEAPPELPYEVAVQVRLDDESGAAGLAFASDEGDRHYGFYPSGGKIRLTHFDGPDVFQWRILHDAPAGSYRLGDWNHLRVRVEAEKIVGFVNGEKVVEIADAALRGGKAGICKFRQSEAEYKQFALGKSLAPPLNADARERRETLEAAIARIPAADANADALDTLDDTRRALETAPLESYRLLQREAKALDDRASRLRELAEVLHDQSLINQMTELLKGREDFAVDLFHGALLIAKLANAELDVESYREELDFMTDELMDQIDAEAGDEQRLKALIDYLFNQQGFHGSRLDYYNRENSFLSAVMDDREGIPITLSVLFIELAHRIGLTDVVGLPLPFHFVVQYRPRQEADREIIDVFANGQRHRGEAARDFVRETSRVELEDVEPADNRQILVRILRNLIGIELESGQPVRALPYLDALLSLAPEESQERLSRAILRFQKGQLGRAREDVTWILENRPEGVRLDRIEQLASQIDGALDARARQ